MDKNAERKTRLPRTRRVAEEVPNVRLTLRDAAIIKAVYEHRALTSKHIEDLYFSPSSRSQCLLRLKLLYHHGYLLRMEQPQVLSEGRKPLVYFLDVKGAQFLAGMEEIEERELDWRPGEANIKYPFLEHLLMTNDVRIALTLAVRRRDYTLTEWRDERDLKRAQADHTVILTGANGAQRKSAAIADGYFQLIMPSRPYHFFLELDRATVTGTASDFGKRDWSKKVQTYLTFFHSGRYEELYETQSKRVLTVTTGEKRLANLKQITAAVGGKTWFWFTTLERVLKSDPIADPIWEVANREGKYPLVEDAR